MDSRWVKGTAVVGVVVVAGALGACSKKKNPVEPQAKPEVTNALTITGLDYAFGVEGAVKAGVTKMTFKNGGKDIHMVAGGKLKPGKTVADIQKALTTDDDKDDKLVFDMSVEATNFPQILTPGASTTTYPTLTEGTFGLVCYFSTAEGKPHFAAGMINEFKVAAGTETVEPEPSLTATIDDKTFGLPDITSGKQTIKVTNNGKSDHDLTFVKLNDGKTFDQMVVVLDKFFQGKAKLSELPGGIAGGIVPVKPGTSGVVEIDLPPGKYVAMDTQSKSEGDGNEYFRDKNGGFRKEFTIA
jgi:hypothetical protein